MLRQVIKEWLPVQPVYAHCDIPCGVYSQHPSLIAAEAVVKLSEKLVAAEEELKSTRHPQAAATFNRILVIKEREAQRCKDELLILWTDYFKPEHLKAYPNLHDTFWQAAKQCSQAKRVMSVDEAQKLHDMVQGVAKIFTEAEAAKAKP